MIDWNQSKLTKDDYTTLGRIADKVQEVAGKTKIDRMTILMDLEACHMVCPLDFAKLEGFDAFNLSHDVAGIANHLNRTTGELENCFLPRCAS